MTKLYNVPRNTFIDVEHLQLGIQKEEQTIHPTKLFFYKMDGIYGICFLDKNVENLNESVHLSASTPVKILKDL